MTPRKRKVRTCAAVGGAALLVAICIATCIGVALAAQHPAAACARLSAEHRHAGELYLAGPVPTAVADEVARHVDGAAARIEAVFGAPQSRPRMLVVADEQIAAAWGANATASMHRAPWGACIVLGPEGRNVDVIAHEWLHAEIQHRVGFWRFLREIPTWFDEGAALIVDHREPYRPENIELPEHVIEAVRGLDRGAAFFAGDVRTHYRAARLAVEPLVRPATFFDDLDRIGRGQAFDEVFLP
ncbi:hypothetical protein [Halomonas denitrificans]|nr:hypothetical protein [Halomonas denitrificans]